MDRALWRWDAVDLAAAVRIRKISSREAQHPLPTPIDRVM